MNILVPISWLKDFLKTEASTEKIAETLSLCSQSVERIHQVGKDEVLEIEITVNRYDCLSVIGIAREAAAILPLFGIKAKFIPPKIFLTPKIKNENPKNKLEVKIKDLTICPRFSAILIDNVDVKPSPKWLAERLNEVDIRSLNNVVDVSNYLMMETGQPIHTFDFDKIKGQKMIMRLSKKGEKVTTLDGIERTFAGEDIVIEDGTGRIIDLCGIMGGKNSEIDENTKRVLFFVQAYDPVKIRRTSMLLGLRTEAAMRFERGIDLEEIIPVISRGVNLLEKLSGGKVAGNLIDIYPKKQSSAEIAVSFNFLKQRLGIDIDNNTIINILKSLGFVISSRTKDDITVLAPSWRAKDILIKEDILEEVARIYGYFRLPSRIPPLSENYGLMAQPLPKKGTISPTFKWEEKTKDLLKAFGFSETYNFSFISEETIKRCLLKKEDHLKLVNPITADLKFLRVSLIPSLIEVYAKNMANFPKIKIFEMANCYFPKYNDLPNEIVILSSLSNGNSFLELKGYLSQILKELGINDYQFAPLENIQTEPYWQKNNSALIKSGKTALGILGQIDDKVTNKYLIKETLFAFFLDMQSICSLANDNQTFQPILKFPPIIEDLSFTFLEKTFIGDVIQSIKAVDPLIKNVALIDSFEKTKTFRITYQHPDRGLSDKDITKIREKVIKICEDKFLGKLKGL